MLTIEGLTKTYAAEAGGRAGGVFDANVVFRPGAFFTLLGPSGCGKTTTLRCIAGLETPDAGTIQVGERMFFDASARVNVAMNRRRIGMVFQSYAIWSHLTVFENVAFPLRVDNGVRHGRAEIQERVGRALHAVDLGGLGPRESTRLSGGQQQRVALARALVMEPDLLLLDEPLSNLDAALREEMRSELKRLQRTLGLTTVYVTHDQTEALEMSDLIAVMDRGRIVQLGTPQEIYFKPRTAFVASFVGTSNWLRGIALETVGDRCRIRLVDGTVVAGIDSNGDGTAGMAAQLSVRPESVRVHPPGQPTPAAVNSISGTVVSAGFQGSLSRLQVQTAAGVLVAHAEPHCTFAFREQVNLTFGEADAMLLPSR